MKGTSIPLSLQTQKESCPRGVSNISGLLTSEIREVEHLSQGPTHGY